MWSVFIVILKIYVTTLLDKQLLVFERIHVFLILEMWHEDQACIQKPTHLMQ